jgi:serine protease inhibitor
MEVTKEHVVGAANNLTANWAKVTTAGQNTVFSGAGAWAVITSLLAGACGEAQAELETACGFSRAAAAEAVQVLLRILAETTGVSGGFGLWTRPDTPVRPEYVALLPGVTVEPLPDDSEVLHQWVKDQTKGLISKFPGNTDAKTLLILASVMVARSKWTAEFATTHQHWTGTTKTVPFLKRNGTKVDEASVLKDGSRAISRVCCRTTHGFDIHLLSGAPSDSPAEVLGVGIAALNGAAEVTPGSRMVPGDKVGALSVKSESSEKDRPQLVLTVPKFNIFQEHNLLELGDVMGLDAARDGSRDHFPGISAKPLSVQSGEQHALIKFSEAGLEAAAVTVVRIRPGSGGGGGSVLTKPPHRVVVIRMNLTVPFGFLVVSRSSNLVLFGGWVNNPTD